METSAQVCKEAEIAAARSLYKTAKEEARLIEKQYTLLSRTVSKDTSLAIQVLQCKPRHPSIF